MANENTDYLSMSKIELRQTVASDITTYLREKYGDDLCESSMMPEIMYLASMILSGKYLVSQIIEQK
ncbi:hypothetical protein [Xenorhabdus cabanillasii]|uniref:Uncharacterized protein n=1 Tax=Xenorhabdus cabanillasii JM26 TaxID=1427517 RepID=W1ISI9_9GAMM|nr:hypothetical protein [Xenorhabdus cabanillasii]PHM76052.1 hypothetical protein Xcab_03434 [Xenorhabdus cabanillasii JM26]CDL80200.1 hypothetical protein XCR1_1410025 [Xenorhabdus cabanillasii JM26]